MNPIVYAIPVFFLLMAIEWVWSRAQRRPVYRLGDSISSIGLGAMSQLVGLYSKLLSFGIYVLVFQQFALFELSAEAWWVWVLALLLYDFCYYWNHRLGHEVGVLWASHVVHHQSQDYNLGTALRQSSTGFLLGWIFYLPLAVLGVPPLVFAVVALIDLLYQYWIHTELVGKLGWFDRVFASPSNHRVHHGVNDRYLDKNYGGILILWDRLFGTFEDERDDDPVVYGTRKPLRSHDPIWANLEVYATLARDAWRTRNWPDKLRVWWKPPGWRPADLAAAEPAAPFVLAQQRKESPALSAAASAYAALAFVLLIAAGTHCLALAGRGGEHALDYAGYAAWIVVTLWTLGRWLDARFAARWLHAACWLALPLAALPHLGIHPAASAMWGLAASGALLAICAFLLAPAQPPQAMALA